MEGIRIPGRCDAAPSSVGFGIVDQSGASMLLFIGNLVDWRGLESAGFFG
jgi:hypothetical protein